MLWIIYNHVLGLIEANAQIHMVLPNFYDADEQNEDLLWSCLTLLNSFIKSTASVAVTMGVCALGKYTCCMNHRVNLIGW